MLVADDLNAMLDRIGQRWAWRRAYRCPCVQAGTNQANPACPICDGKGWMYEAATVEGVAGVSGAKVQRQWREFGTFEAGDVVVSVGSDSPIYAVGPYDRIRQIDSDEPFSMIWQPGQKLKFLPTSIERAFWVAGAAVHDLAPPVVADDGSLTWSAPPPAKTPVSFTGRRPVEYFVFQDIPVSRGHQLGDTLPRKVVLRRFDLLGR